MLLRCIGAPHTFQISLIYVLSIYCSHIYSISPALSHPSSSLRTGCTWPAGNSDNREKHQSSLVLPFSIHA